ncbi:hypothetical protein FO519_010036, partial [Halicephalobus sp. NKZ332]
MKFFSLLFLVVAALVMLAIQSPLALADPAPAPYCDIKDVKCNPRERG